MLTIVFLGTPSFAVASLAALYQAGFTIAAVVTAPDKPAGRGMQLQQSAVKQYAVEKNIPVLQPEKLKNPEFLAQLKSYKADVQVVVAFRMLPEIVWNMPPMGTVNLHGSLLPQYRGAAPINWAIINGETETGVTTFKLQQEIDTGNILLQKTIPIRPDETAGELHDEMMETGAQLLVRTIQGLAAGTLTEQPQEDDRRQTTDDRRQTTDDGRQVERDAAPNENSSSGYLSSVVCGLSSSLRHAPKLYTETGKIDWTKDAATIYNLIRGLSPYPGAFTQLNGKMLKVYAAQKEVTASDAAPGTYETDGKTFLKFACADGFIRVTDIQPEGKRRMLVNDFLRGFRGVVNNEQ